MRRTLALSLLCLLVAFSARAEELNIPSLVRDRLRRDGKISCENPFEHLGIDVGNVRCDYEIRNIRAVSVNVKLGSITAEAIPKVGSTSEFLAKNCTSRGQTRNETISVSIEEGLQATVSTAITSTEEIKASISLGGLTGEAGRSMSVSLSRSETTEQRRTVTRQEEIKREVPPLTALYIRADFLARDAFVPFDGTVILDAEIFTIVWVGSQQTQPTFRGRLSTFYPAEADRTFTAKGQIWNSKADKLVITYLEKSLDPADPRVCPNLGDILGRVGQEQLSKDAEAKLESLTPSDAYGPIRELAPNEAAELFRDTSESQNAVPLAATLYSVGVRQFRAKGVHTCQSQTDIGHTCRVLGSGYTDCNQASLKLKMEDCCPSTRRCGRDPETKKEQCRYGGKSIGFGMEQCTIF